MKNIWLETYNKVTKVYPYRTARVNIMFSIRDITNDDFYEMRTYLEDKAKANGITDISGGNHCVFELSSRNGSDKIYIMLSDLNIHIGTRVEEKVW